MKRQKLDPLQRAILVRLRSIHRLKGDMQRIQRNADDEIRKIKRKIAEREVIIEALKKGTIAP